ncbi:hypothetical protein [Shouchella miscanthi]|uniref:Uncharacterized protein n=1 Tax=Shouchella miscanthi TaxID=2598861 RepID=A0ABU6NE99_9BACI|nr:hypothetical protein [Shouchella miscanthi]
MKKGFYLLLVGGLILSACGSSNEESNQDNTINTQANEETTAETEETSTSQETDDLLNVDLSDESLSQAEWTEAFEVQEKAIDYEIEEVSYAWSDGSINLSNLSHYALITNTGKGSIYVNPLSVTFYNDDGSVITKSEMGLSASPEIINEGESSLIDTLEQGDIEDIETFDFAKLKYEVFFSPQKALDLTAENVKFDTDQFVSATAVIKNETNIDATEEIKGSIIFFDGDNNFIGGVSSSIDSLESGEQGGFEAFYPNFPDTEKQNIESAEVLINFVDLYGENDF